MGRLDSILSDQIEPEMDQPQTLKTMATADSNGTT